MTGPQHYAYAETLLGRADEARNDKYGSDESGYLAAAQVHATLALAAATAQTGGLAQASGSRVAVAWWEAIL